MKRASEWKREREKPEKKNKNQIKLYYAWTRERGMKCEHARYFVDHRRDENNSRLFKSKTNTFTALFL